MKHLKRSLLLLTVVSFIFVQTAHPAWAKYVASQAPTQITKNAPQISALPEEALPAAPAEKKSSKAALWALLGVAVLAGAAAAIGGGGGGGGGGDGDSTGSLSVGW
jgi:hypothetical protein